MRIEIPFVVRAESGPHLVMQKIDWVAGNADSEVDVGSVVIARVVESENGSLGDFNPFRRRLIAVSNSIVSWLIEPIVFLFTFGFPAEGSDREPGFVSVSQYVSGPGLAEERTETVFGVKGFVC